jgi:hypothetical protein
MRTLLDISLWFQIHSGHQLASDKRMGKKRRILFLLILLSSIPGLKAANRISLNLAAGLDYSSFGDVNAGVRGSLDNWKDLAALSGGTYVSGLKPLHASPAYSFDLVYKIDDYYSIGLGVGYLRANNTSTMTVRFAGEPLDHSAINAPDVRAVPVRMSVFRFIPINQRTRISFHAGIDTYFVQFRSVYLPAGPGNGIRQKAHAIGLGLRCGVGLEVELTSHLAFVFEGQGRYASVHGFHGVLEAGGSSLPYEERGDLYYWDQTITYSPDIQRIYPHMFIQEVKPSGGVYSNVRQARVDLSGFGIVAGIKIYL